MTKNKFHNQPHGWKRRLIPVLCLIISTTVVISQTPSTARPQTVGEKRYKPELVIQTGHTSAVSSVAFSPDGKTLASAGGESTIKLWNIETGQQRKSLEGHTNSVRSVAFSPDGKTLVSGSRDNIIKLWNVESGQLFKTLEGHTSSVKSVAFSPYGNYFISGSLDGTVRLWDLKGNKSVSTLTSLNKEDWVVTTLDTSFDASAEALKLMHFIVSDAKFGFEVITLDQLKSKSFTPGLLRDIYTGKRNSGTAEFTITLYPLLEIKPSNQKPNLLDLKLENRGGGIGRVEVYLNGKEFLSDARQRKSVNPEAAVVNLPIEISKDKLNAGANKIEVITWNTEGDVRSPSKEYVLLLEANGAVRGKEVIYLDKKKQTFDGHFYAIVAGVSDYAGDSLDLRFAAKDAEDMAQAVALGARRLFCSPELKTKKLCERVHIRLFSTEKEAAFEVANVDFKRTAPTKQNFKEVFAEIASKTKPEDVVVVYFSGHGTAIKSEEALRESAFPDLYIYPTMEADTLDKIVLGNKDLRDRKYVTSLELANWVNQIKAERKVMIFDTCAAGAIQADLTKQARSDDEDKFRIRALDRLRERTGFFVLMGSAADAVSYEANNYRQGLLTYSLLEAMTGARLRDDRWVDVEEWFKYAEEKVDILAKDIGGIQRPRYFKSNFNAQSFDVGEVNPKEDKIPLSPRVPMILQPVLLDKTQLFDSLKLTEILIPKLRELSIRISRHQSAINYVPARIAKGGILPSGLYTISGENVTVELVLRRDEKEIIKLEVKGTKNDIAEKLLQFIVTAASE